jgi:hypothetical protein
MGNQRTSGKRRLSSILGILLLILLSPLVVVVLTLYLLAGIALHVTA